MSKWAQPPLNKKTDLKKKALVTYSVPDSVIHKCVCTPLRDTPFENFSLLLNVIENISGWGVCAGCACV